jgi:FkbM family methyltransferase
MRQKIPQASSPSKEITSWLGGVRLGYGMRDKVFLFIHIASAIIIILLFISLFGRKRGAQILLKNLRWLNWMPVDSVKVKLGYNKVQVLISLPLRVDYTILLSSTWEDAERDFVSGLSLETGAVIDVGANIGIYSVVLAKSHPKLKVIAVEASPIIFEWLARNCVLNKLSNVTLVNAAVSDQDDTVTDFYERDSMSTMLKGFLLDFGIGGGEGKDGVQRRQIGTRTLDSIIGAANLDEISLLKLDIEGAEILALRGASNSLVQKKIKNMLIEYHSLPNYNQLRALMDQYRYAYSNHQRPQLFDDERHVNGHVMATLSNGD